MASYKKEKRFIYNQHQCTPTDLYEKPRNGKGFHFSVKAKCMQAVAKGTVEEGDFSLLQGDKKEAFDEKITRPQVKNEIADRICLI